MPGRANTAASSPSIGTISTACPSSSSRSRTSSATRSAVPVIGPTRMMMLSPMIGRFRCQADIMHVMMTTGNIIQVPMSASAEQASEAAYLHLLGERIREARARRGMTRKILARDSQVSERYLAQLESGQGNISIILLRQIAQAMGLPLTDLVREGPDRPVEL